MSINGTNGAFCNIAGPITATNAQSALSITCWINANSNPLSDNFSLCVWSSNSGTAVRIALNATLASPGTITLQARAADGDTLSSFISGATALSPGSWRHVVATLDYATKTPKMYINGVNFALTGTNNLSGTATSATNTVAAKFCCSIANNISERYLGLIEDVRLYQRIISIGEAMTMYTAKGMDGIVQGLAMRYPLNDQGEGQTAVGPINIGSIDRITGTNPNAIAAALLQGKTIMTPRKRAIMSLIK